MNFLFLKRNRFAILLAFTIIMVMPLSAICQEQDQEEENINTAPVSGGSTGPVIGSSSPWGNSNSTQDANATTDQNGVSSGTGNGSATQPGTLPNRLGRPSKVLDRTPGGNPDVPFDDNMNLVFLVAGLTFAVWVVRRKIQKASANNL